ncbi:MAG: SusD/RagB family nutrient-binding outer membrane lipoprotein [Bacteroidales bacterium]
MKKNILLIVMFSALFVSGCGNWLDINKSPNTAGIEDVTDELLLTACEFDMLNNHVNSSNAMLISQHLTKSGEFSGNYTFLSGSIMPQNVDAWWNTYYETNNNLKLIYNNSVKSGDRMHKGIAQTLTILNFQRLVDIFGNIPYSEACDAYDHPQPKYDDAATIYADLILKIDEAIADVEAGAKDYTTTLQTAHTKLEKADILCQGDVNLWIRFAYTIKLRLLMRVSNVQDVNTQVNAIIGKCLNINENVLANPGYYAETDKMNLFYEMYGWDKQGADNSNHRQYMPTSALVDMLRNNNDPRLRVYVDPRRNLDDPAEAAYSKYGLDKEPYVGIPYGQAAPPRKSYCGWTGTGALAGGANKETGRLRSSVLIAGSEVGFFLAEAALRGMIPGGDAKAKEYYEAAVISAMKRHEQAMQDPTSKYEIKNMAPAITGTAEDAAKVFLSQNNDFVNWDKMTSNDRKLEAICSQKWLSYFGYNPLESWFEQRRNDLPKLKASNQGQQSKIICRVPYPQIERNLNAPNVALQPEVDVYNSLIFWDKKNDIVERTELYQ